MYFTIYVDDDLVIVDDVAIETPINKDDLPSWVEIIWWDGETGMLQHRDNTKSVPMDNYDDYQPILDAYYQELNKRKQAEKTPEQQARETRNFVRKQTDMMFNPGYTIQDELLTKAQRKELLDFCIRLARWPKQPNWPAIELPPPPEWLAPLLTIPDWPKNN
ncbi:hypothetical protein H0A36_29540 [Endozoicomonas sp. SM1973]|uniref:Phage tail protein n=1 Tax=Spartinivicinus marinus TaxID=2994442 RepID=A0A853IB27_9GAMM|nr:hypothetical protein [Spartinivicinus marinus]NYZ70159.1 hypothetical protein [Spartinivicinus marinus]